MKNHLLKRLLSMLLVVALLAGYYVPGASAAVTGLNWKESDQEVRLDLTEREAENHVEQPYAATDIVRVSIVLEEKSTVQAGYATRNIAENAEAMAYSRSLRAKQDALAKTISAQALNGKPLDVVWHLTLVGNIISANVPYGRLDAIAKVDGVADVFVETTYAPCVIDREDVANPQMFASVQMTGSSLVWSGGYTGAGTRVAIIDTGTDTDHQSLDAGAFLYALEQNAKAAGVSYETYLEGLNLLDRQEIAGVLADLNIYEMDSSLTAQKLYINQKLPFAVNYIDDNDRRLVVDHESDDQSEHGSHVAGIAAANRYIPSGSSYADAMETVKMSGTAPDAQIITMKVFGKNGGPSDADYLAAVEDAILLGCDAVNLSLGSVMAGPGTNKHYADLLEYMTKTDTVVVGSGGNSFSWPEAALFGYLYSEDVNLDTVGAPGSYYSFFSVASVENDGGVIPAFLVGDDAVEYFDSTDGSYYPFITLDTSADLSGTKYEYVFIDGLGDSADYAGIDLTGKIVFCSRGSTNFAVKANNAAALGAAATIVYNNEGGILYMDLTGYRYTKPCVSITQADANAIRAASQKKTTSGGLTYYTGTMTAVGQNIGVMYDSEYYTMSNFSSWGVPGDLSLKPEITAPGGNIYSIYGETPDGGGADRYELMSGTSMAAPAITGMAALVAQYIRENGLAEQENLKVRTLTQSLLMSTAVPMMEEGSGNYYSLLKQGAGLARADLATAAESYILVDGQSDGKVKAELGDDPNRTGVYKFSFSINNLTDKTQSYTLSADIFCQDAFEYQEGSDLFLLDTCTTSLPGTAAFTVDGKSVSSQGDLSRFDMNGDGKTDAADADYLLEYLVENEADLHGQGDVNEDGRISSYDAHVLLAMLSTGGDVSVPAGGSVNVDVTLTLTASGKTMLDNNYANGTYVEAYVYAKSESTTEGVAGTTHSIPVLAFYGNWSDPNMFDHASYVELMHNDYDLPPYLYNEIGSGNALTISYGDGEEYYFGGNPMVSDDYYLPERNAFNSEDASYLYAQYFSLIRNAAEMQILISNADTDEVYLQEKLGECDAAFYHVNGGRWMYTQQRVPLGWSGTDAQGKPLPEGTNVEVSLIAIPEYYVNADGSLDYENLGDGIYLTTPMTIDNTAPQVLDMQLDGSVLTVEAKDNRHVAAVILMNSAGTVALAHSSPNQTEAEAEVSVELDLSTVYDKKFLLAVVDYASNIRTYEIELELDNERPRFTAINRTDANADGSVNYVGMNISGTYATLAPTSGRDIARAATYVDGYVFEISADNKLYVGADKDLYSFRFLRDLDPTGEYQINGFNDLAFNKADEKLYGLFYSELNSEKKPYLCTIDLFSGEMTVLGEMPFDANTLTIDGEGNFYSTVYGESILYRYAANVLETESYVNISSLNGYSTTTLSSLAWDYETDELFFGCTQTGKSYLLEVDPATGSTTYHTSFPFVCVGLYVAEEPDGSVIGAVNAVTSVELPETALILVGETLQLQALVNPWNVSDASVTWSSSNSNVAAVGTDGVVTGVNVGEATITATSNLDPTKRASCVVTVGTLNRTLKAVVWDEFGDISWISFNTDRLPSYTERADVMDNIPLTTTAIANGTLYASSLDFETGLSDLYTVNPENYEMTYVGGSESIAYTDLTYSPSLGYLFATYFNYICLVDPSNGEYQGAWNWTGSESHNLVGITYYGTAYNGSYDAYVDYFLILDEEGNVYLDGFMYYGGQFYYFNGVEDGFVAKIGDSVDTPYFQGFHYDGTYTYWTRLNEADNVVELLVWDCDGTGDVHRVGEFPEGVWPVGGLYSDAELTSVGTLAAEFEWENLSPNAMVTEVEPGAFEKPTFGGVNTASGTISQVEPQGSGEFIKDSGKVTVTITPANQLNGTTNGRMTITYNPEELKLVSVTGTTDAFAYNAESGSVELAYASAQLVTPDTSVAQLTFEVIVPGEHEIVITHIEDGDEPSGKQEYIYVTTGCKHEYNTAVVDPTCTEEGYTLYICKYCDHTYKGDFQDPLGHSYEDGSCVRCGEAEFFTQWISATTSLNGTIDLNIYVALSDNILNDPNAYVRFIRNGVAVDVPMSEAVEAEKRGQICYRFSCEIFAKQVADTITIQVMNADGAISNALEYSVMKYCVNQINSGKDAELVALCKALLNYAAAAQTYFHYNTENMANASLSDADKVLPSVDASAYKFNVVGSEPGIKPRSATLNLESEVAIRVYFIVEEGYDISDFTFTIDGKEVVVQQNEKGYYIESEGIAAKELDDMHQFSVGGLTVNYGALSYVNSKAGGSNINEANLAKALYAYYVAAEALLG